MPTDRSLWVDDKYALRCRECGEKFTMFRRRHHCRRCGQVFCYECLYNAQFTAPSQSLMGNVYELFAPSPSRVSHLSPVKAAMTAFSSSSPVGAPSITVDEDVQTELSTRLCRRCAATILKNAERDSSAPRLEFCPSSSNSQNATSLRHPGSPFSPAAAAASPRSTSLPQSVTPLRRTSVLPQVCSASAIIGPSMPGDIFSCDVDKERQQQQRQPQQNDEDEENNNGGGCSKSWRTARHEETAEEREVTYSIARVQRLVPANMTEWWAARQATTKSKERRKLSACAEDGGALFGVTTPGAVVYVLTDPIDFSATFRVGRTATRNAAADEEVEVACQGSAAAHEDDQLSDEEASFIDSYSAACSANILSRIRNSVEATFPSKRVCHFSSNLAAVAWHVVRHTAVALGATIDEHVACFSVSCPSLPPQCVVYPGLICAQRLPSKRAMTTCNHPRVLLLAGHLSYPLQPAEDLVDYVRSYSGYLDKLFQRLTVWSPDVIVVEGGMHHYLRERIEAAGHMRLLLHVGRSFLVQLSWCLHADIIADLQYVSTADLVATTPMGECSRFEVVELAEEERFCAFTGFTDVRFHTLVFRGPGLMTSARSSISTATTPDKKNSNRTESEDRKSAAQHQWNALEQLGREAIIAAYHVAMQSHWVRTLLHSSSPFASAVASAVTTLTEAAANMSYVTLNGGCQFAPRVIAALHSAGAAVNLIRDTIVLNVVLMDHLFESSNSSSTTAATATGGLTKGTDNVPTSSTATTASTAAGNVTNSLARALSSDVVVTPFLPGSYPSSGGASRTELAGLYTSKLEASALSQTAVTRAESAAGNAYAVVQQKVALTFYGSGDDSLCAFLVSRCTSAESQVLYLHGGHRVRVTVTRAALRSSVTANSVNGSSNSPPPHLPPVTGEAASTSLLASHPALEEAQKVAFYLAAMRHCAARTFVFREPKDSAVANAWLIFLKGYFSLKVSSEVAGQGGPGDGAAVPDTPPIVDVSVPLCSPHLLNYSTAAFLEWVLYGWTPLLAASSSSIPQQQQLRFVFSFHPDASTTTTVARIGGIGPAAVFKDTVTLVVDPVPLLRIQYPPAVLPSPPFPTAPTSKLPTEVSTADVWYALHDAAELEKTLDGLHTFLRGLFDSTASSAQPKSIASDKPPDALNTSRQRSVPAYMITALSQQLCDRVKRAVEMLRESRAFGEAEVAMCLRSLRQHLIPAAMADYRAWQVEVRKTSSTKAAPASSPTTANSRDSPDAAAGMSFLTAHGVLCSLEGCYFHPARTQWIRLGEPASVIAATLNLLYGGAAAALTSPSSPFSPVIVKNARSSPQADPLPVSPAALSAAPTGSGPHVSFDVGTETSPVADQRSSFSTSSTRTTGPPLARREPQLLFTSTPTRTEALDILRRCVKSDASRPASLAYSLRGYKPVLPLNKTGSAGGGGGGVGSTVNAIVEAGTTSASAIIGFGGVSGGSGSSDTSNADGSELNISVEVLFPHAFAALHVLYAHGAPLDVPAALLRSHPYMTDGGKSQSCFFLTEDGRFLVKCVKPTELHYFKEWAPRYFAHIAEYYTSTSKLSRNQSTLSKILGLYVVHFHSSRSRSTTQLPTPGDTALAQQQPQQSLHSFFPDGMHCFMVEEHLLFQRPVRETWDLKGSQRNRTTEQTAAVRLDVDFVQERLRRGDFFFCIPEEKSLLMDHLSRDTQLLSDSGIMDYSLMASIGSGNLYVGMIDFLHPYSSAKVLESKMKSGLDTVLGYGRRNPTIIDPSNYAARFMLWMDGYFNGVPDRLFPLTRVRRLAELKEENNNTAAATAADEDERDAAAK